MYRVLRGGVGFPLSRSNPTFDIFFAQCLQAHDEALRVAVWREAHRILEEAAGPGVPDVTVALTVPDVGRAR